MTDNTDKEEIDMKDKYKAMEEAMTEFVARCEAGSVRSRYTYAKFKDILAMPDNTRHTDTLRDEIVEAVESINPVYSDLVREPYDPPKKIVLLSKFDVIKAIKEA